jgi:hypothetical protein
MSVVEFPGPARPRSGGGAVATIAVIAGVVGAVIGVFIPAVEFYVPAALGVVPIGLAVIDRGARGRAWIAVVLAAVTLAEAGYSMVQLDRAERALGAIARGEPAAVGAVGRVVTRTFGTTYVGATMSVGLSRPAVYVPSDSAMVTQQTGRAVAFTVTVGDAGNNQLFPAMGLSFHATSGNAQDQGIEDWTNNVGPSSAAILPGHSLSWTIAFSVPRDASDITVAVSSIGDGATIVFAETRGDRSGEGAVEPVHASTERSPVSVSVSAARWWPRTRPRPCTPRAAAVTAPRR